MNPSSQAVFDATPEQKESLAKFFYSRLDRYDHTNRVALWHDVDSPIIRPNKDGVKKGHWAAWPKRTVTKQDFIDMFEGKNKGVGTYLNGVYGMTHRIVIDLDTHEARTVEDLEYNRFALQQVLSLIGLPYMLERSKSGAGYHFELWFVVPIQSAKGRRFARSLIEQAGLTVEPGRSNTAEIYCKQDKLEEGTLGNQVGRPGSIWWYERTGGSVYVLPSTLQPVPMSQWEDMIRACGINPDDPAIDKYIETHAKPEKEEPKPVYASNPEGVKSVATLAHLMHALEKWGLHPRSPRRYTVHGYEWIIELGRCANSEHHSCQSPGDAGVGGARVFFGENKGIGYKCHHDSCKDLSWRKARDICDPHHVIPLADEVPWWAPRPMPHGPNEGEAVKPPDGLVWKGRGLPHTHRFQLYCYWLSHANDQDAKVARFARRCRRVANCGLIAEERYCGTDTFKPESGNADGLIHGLRKRRILSCDDHLLCPYCAERAVAVSAAHARDTWGQCVVMEVPGAPGKRLVNREAFAQAMHNRVSRSHKPRWLEGWSSTLAIWRAEDLPYVKEAFGDQVEVLDPGQVYDRIFSHMMSITSALINTLERNGGRPDAWLSTDWSNPDQANLKRTAGGKCVCEELNWWGPSEARKALAEREEENGLTSTDHCDVDGCSCILRVVYRWLPTGEIIYSGWGAPYQSDLERVVEESPAINRYWATPLSKT